MKSRRCSKRRYQKKTMRRKYLRKKTMRRKNLRRRKTMRRKKTRKKRSLKRGGFIFNFLKNRKIKRQRKEINKRVLIDGEEEKLLLDNSENNHDIITKKEETQTPYDDSQTSNSPAKEKDVNETSRSPKLVFNIGCKGEGVIEAKEALKQAKKKNMDVKNHFFHQYLSLSLPKELLQYMRARNLKV